MRKSDAIEEMKKTIAPLSPKVEKGEHHHMYNIIVYLYLASVTAVLILAMMKHKENQRQAEEEIRELFKGGKDESEDL